MPRRSQTGADFWSFFHTLSGTASLVRDECLDVHGHPSNPVTMVAQMGALMDGANYPARTDLSVPSSKIEVEVVNTGYRKM